MAENETFETPSNHENTEFFPGHDDLVDEFTSNGWSGDLAGALKESPFRPVPPDRGDASTSWKPFFRDYLRDLPDHIRTKYAIQDTNSQPESDL